MGRIEAVNIAHVRTGEWTGRVGSTGIDKRPVSAPVMFDSTGVAGDSVVDREHHGSWHQAAYAFDVEDLRAWSEQLGRELRPGNAGENLSLADCDCSRAVVGERWRVGDAVLRVTGPRVPCKVFAGFWDQPDLVKRFTARGRPGAYFAVEQAGRIGPGETVDILHRPEHGVTVAQVFALRMRLDPGLFEHVRTALADLPKDWVKDLRLAD